MKRWISLLLAGLLLFVSLGGCTPDTGGESSATHSELGEEADQDDGPAALQPEEAGFAYYLDPGLPRQVRELILQNRAQTFRPFDDNVAKQAERFITPGLDREKDMELAELVLAYQYSDEAMMEILSDFPQSISREQAQEEVGFLFDYLKYGYSGYQILGGDEVFFPVREEMLQELETAADPVDLYTYKYDILIPGLEKVIVDAHFVLDSHYFTESYTKPYFCYSEEVTFSYREESYAAQVDGEELVLQSVNGQSPQDWLLPFLDSEGNAVWVVGGNFIQNEPVAVELKFAGGETLSLILSPADYSYRQEFDPEVSGYNRTEADGVTVIENRRLYNLTDNPLDTDDPQLSELVSDAEGLREEPVLVIDLRCNGGGNDAYAYEWVQNYAGTDAVMNGSINAAVTTQTAKNSAQWIKEYVEGNFGTDYQESWSEMDFVPASLVENKNLVVVLTDNGIASSGESFVAALREMENVVIVGTNTSGCGTMGNIRGVFLPHSKLVLTCGISLFLQPDLSGFEGVGYQPDLWAPPGESLDRVLLFLKNSGII